MRRVISVVTMLAMLLAITSPVAAGRAAGPPCSEEDSPPPGRMNGDLRSGRLSFEASNGFSITGQIKPHRLLVTITDDLGHESVVFEVKPPRRESRSAEFRMDVGGATFVRRSGVEGELGEVQITHPDGRSAHHLDLEGSPAAPWVPETPDSRVYELLREIALDQASFSFWEGVDQLAQELAAATNPTEPASCFFTCLTCVAAIIAYIASLGGLVVGCGTMTPACILAVLAHQAGNVALIAACGECAVCLDGSEGVDRRYGTGEMIPNVQQ